MMVEKLAGSQLSPYEAEQLAEATNSVPNDAICRDDLGRLEKLAQLSMDAGRTGPVDDGQFRKLLGDALTLFDLTPDDMAGIFSTRSSVIEGWLAGNNLPRPAHRRLISAWIATSADEESNLVGR